MNKNKKEVKEPSEVEKAAAIIYKDQERKSNAFLLEYRALCKKHGLAIQAMPIQFHVVPYQGE